MRKLPAQPLVVFAAVAITFVADPAIAKRVSIQGNNETQVQRRCGSLGSRGTYFPKTGPNSTYGCLNSDGSGIVCGGKTQTDKKTCDKFREAPRCLPTRGEAKELEGPDDDKEQKNP